jgi:hypothetical protein
MAVPIPVILIEFSPFLLLATLAHSRAESKPRGEVEAPNIWGGIATAKAPTPDSTHETSRFMAYVVSHEIHALKQNPVENFGALEAIISMCASTKNGMQLPTQAVA